MQTHARVVVIGGGIVGCSVLHHLARMGWTDVALVERDELTFPGRPGTPPGTARLFDQLYNLMTLQAYSNRLYRRLPEEVDCAIAHRACGSIRLAPATAWAPVHRGRSPTSVTRCITRRWPW
jgi:dimethylglycine dehydrogenase